MCYRVDMMKREEITTVLRYERNRLRREMEKHIAERSQDPTGAFNVGIIEGASLAIRKLTERIHDLESGNDPTYD